MLSIGELARRTGVTVAALRMWEQRHGFPSPQRLPGGHRRYRERDVATIQAVERERADGTRLEVAIRRARAGGSEAPVSLYGALRKGHPELAVHRLSKQTLTAVSRAIEDQCCAQGSGATVYGAFQREEHYRASESRWTELARTAAAATVFADFAASRPDARPIEVTVPADSPMIREWAVVSDATDLPVVLTAWELPGQSPLPDSQRLFEAVWSTEPSIVAEAVTICADLAGEQTGRPARSTEGAPMRSRRSSTPPPDPVAVMALVNRMIAYVDQTTRNSRSHR